MNSKILIDPTINRTFNYNNNEISTCLLSPEMKQCIGGTLQGEVLIWTFKPQMTPFKLQGHKSNINDISINPKGKLIASASNDKTIRIWHNTGKIQNPQIINHHSGPVNSVDFSLDNRFLLSASNDKNIKLFSVLNKYRFISSYIGHLDWVKYAKIGPDIHLISSCGNDNTVKLFDLEKKNLIYNFNDHLDNVNYCNFSPDSNCICSCSNDKSIKIFDIRNGKCIYHLTGHFDKVNKVIFHPNLPYLLSCSDDSTIKIWDLKMSQYFNNIRAHKNKVKSVSFNKDGSEFCSCGDDSFVYVWKSNIKNMDIEYKILSDYLNNQNTLKISSDSKKSTIRDKKNLTVKMKDKDNKNDIDKNIINNTNENNKESNLTNFEFTTSSIDRMVMQLTNFSKTMNEMGQRIDNVEYQIEDIYKRRNMGNIHPNDNKIDSENVIKEVISEENGKINNPVEIFEDIKEHVEDIKQTE